jgi:hypothetical protein
LKPLLAPREGYNYIYRVNCGGDPYVDQYGQRWEADRAKADTNVWGSTSWADDYEGVNPYQASQRYTKDPIKGTKDWDLFGTFRYGRHKLAYYFPLPDGEYRVELYFVEPWYGASGNTDCEGYRIFDVAINDSVYIDDLDIWAEAGHDTAFKHVVQVRIDGGVMKISFPEVKAGQAVISAIAIGSKNRDIQLQIPSSTSDWSWKNIKRVVKTPLDALPEGKETRPATIYRAEQAKVNGRNKEKIVKDQTFIVFLDNKQGSIEWDISVGVANKYALRFDFMNVNDCPIDVKIRVIDSDGIVHKEDTITFPVATEKRRTLSTDTGGYINAGHYKIQLSAENMSGLWLSNLTVQ